MYTRRNHQCIFKRPYSLPALALDERVAPPKYLHAGVAIPWQSITPASRQQSLQMEKIHRKILHIGKHQQRKLLTFLCLCLFTS
jgi:hypothetical protein